MRESILELERMLVYHMGKGLQGILDDKFTWEQLQPKGPFLFLPLSRN